MDNLFAMSKKGPCMNCKLEKPIFLHNVYRNNNVLRICTSCLLKIYRGSFCSICFEVYKTKDLITDPKPIQCIMCPNLGHFNCVKYTSVLASNSRASSSSSLPFIGLHAPYVCHSCSDPNFRFFDCKRDEKDQLARIDNNLAEQLLAASIISQRSMKEGVALCWKRVEERALKASKAEKKANNVMEIYAELDRRRQIRRQRQIAAGRTNVGSCG